jgi:hypothetical protein
VRATTLTEQEGIGIDPERGNNTGASNQHHFELTGRRREHHYRNFLSIVWKE